jgi:hypothetical protein
MHEWACLMAEPPTLQELGGGNSFIPTNCCNGIPAIANNLDTRICIMLHAVRFSLLSTSHRSQELPERSLNSRQQWVTDDK